MTEYKFECPNCEDSPPYFVHENGMSAGFYCEACKRITSTPTKPTQEQKRLIDIATKYIEREKVKFYGTPYKILWSYEIKTKDDIPVFVPVIHIQSDCYKPEKGFFWYEFFGPVAQEIIDEIKSPPKFLP